MGWRWRHRGRRAKEGRRARGAAGGRPGPPTQPAVESGGCGRLHGPPGLLVWDVLQDGRDVRIVFVLAEAAVAAPIADPTQWDALRPAYTSGGATERVVRPSPPFSRASSRCAPNHRPPVSVFCRLECTSAEAGGRPRGQRARGEDRSGAGREGREGRGGLVRSEVACRSRTADPRAPVGTGSRPRCPLSATAGCCSGTPCF